MTLKTTEIHYPNQLPAPAGPCVLAMGFFDGVHRGHQAVLRVARARADALGVPLAVLTYYPHPAVTFTTPDARWQYLSLPDRRRELFSENGVDHVYTVNLTSRLAALSPQDFVAMVVAVSRPLVVVAGFDHTYGADPAVSNMARLPEYAEGCFAVVTVPPVSDATTGKCASRMIRADLLAGKTARANQALGYAYQTRGVVIHGAARGRTLGYPTANVQFSADMLLPKIGIYAVRVCVGDRWYDGMASIGYNVVFGGTTVSVECHLFDFHEMIYGELVRVAWYEYLRPECQFDSVADLVTQLGHDAVASRRYFEQDFSNLKKEC